MLVPATAVAAITWRKKLVITEKGTAWPVQAEVLSSGKFVLVNYTLCFISYHNQNDLQQCKT